MKPNKEKQRKILILGGYMHEGILSMLVHKEIFDW